MRIHRRGGRFQREAWGREGGRGTPTSPRREALGWGGAVLMERGLSRRSSVVPGPGGGQASQDMCPRRAECCTWCLPCPPPDQMGP